MEGSRTIQRPKIGHPFVLGWLVSRLVNRALLAVVFLVATACNTAKLEDTPDATVRCNSGAHVFCAADAGAGCVIAATETNASLKQLAPGTYVQGCVANFVAEDRDQGGDCLVSTICRCQLPGDGGIEPQWACF